ncbi:MAG: hypothetical protein ABW166_16235 [Sedimenticola sp.]
MKFGQLQMGQKFRLNGEIYSKSGPLQAIPEGSGNHKMIMRSAAIELLEPHSDASKTTKTASLDPAVLREAVDRYHQQCLGIVSSGENPLSIETHNQLNTAYLQIITLLEQ